MDTDKFSSVSILYVEDEQAIRDGLLRFFQRRSGKIALAANGAEGLETFKQVRPDIVVTDLEMPIMSGLEMIEKIREISGRDYPIIVITAYKDDEHYTPLADGYIYKPIRLEELENMIITLLQNGAED